MTPHRVALPNWKLTGLHFTNGFLPMVQPSYDRFLPSGLLRGRESVFHSGSRAIWEEGDGLIENR
jgi:hypothetical protein